MSANIPAGSANKVSTLPWFVGNHISAGRSFGDTPSYIAIGNGARSIARVLVDDGTGEAQANAAFIVRAVNAHEELLEALRYVVDSGESYERVQEIAVQAIAKAEGKV